MRTIPLILHFRIALLALIILIAAAIYRYLRLARGWILVARIAIVLSMLPLVQVPVSFGFLPLLSSVAFFFSDQEKILAVATTAGAVQVVAGPVGALLGLLAWAKLWRSRQNQSQLRHLTIVLVIAVINTVLWWPALLKLLDPTSPPTAKPADFLIQIPHL